MPWRTITLRTAEMSRSFVFFGQVMSDKKIIFVLRDGRTCVRSKISRTDQSIAHDCVRWTNSVRVMRYLQRRHPAHLIIKYEDLASRPKQTLEAVCRFLDIPRTDAMLTGVSSDKIPEEYRQETFDTDKLSLRDVPVLCYPLLLQELKDTGYISTSQFWYHRLRYSSWNFPTLAAVTLIFVFGEVFR